MKSTLTINGIEYEPTILYHPSIPDLSAWASPWPWAPVVDEISYETTNPEDNEEVWGSAEKNSARDDVHCYCSDPDLTDVYIGMEKIRVCRTCKKEAR
jgi:hypothetical protein